MTNAPKRVVIFVEVPSAGSIEPLKRMKPIYPAKAKRAQWPLTQPIPRYTPPAGQIEALKRRGREVLDAVRAQRAAHGR
jgi:hypothetical protein